MAPQCESSESSQLSKMQKRHYTSANATTSASSGMWNTCFRQRLLHNNNWMKWQQLPLSSLLHGGWPLLRGGELPHQFVSTSTSPEAWAPTPPQLWKISPSWSGKWSEHGGRTPASTLQHCAAACCVHRHLWHGVMPHISLFTDVGHPSRHSDLCEHEVTIITDPLPNPLSFTYRAVRDEAMTLHLILSGFWLLCRRTSPWVCLTPPTGRSQTCLTGSSTWRWGNTSLTVGPSATDPPRPYISSSSTPTAAPAVFETCIQCVYTLFVSTEIIFCLYHLLFCIFVYVLQPLYVIQLVLTVWIDNPEFLCRFVVSH